LQLNIVGVVGCRSSFRLVGKGVIILETFLEILGEVLKGIVREIGAYFFWKNVLEHKKTTPRRRKLKGGFHRKQLYLTTTTLTVEVAREKCYQHFSLFYYTPIIQ
jgi:hypothetical protein